MDKIEFIRENISITLNRIKNKTQMGEDILVYIYSKLYEIIDSSDNREKLIKHNNFDILRIKISEILKLLKNKTSKNDFKTSSRILGRFYGKITTNLRKANKAKNDEFYTQLIDMEKSFKYYEKYFKNKTSKLKIISEASSIGKIKYILKNKNFRNNQNYITSKKSRLKDFIKLKFLFYFNRLKSNDFFLNFIEFLFIVFFISIREVFNIYFIIVCLVFLFHGFFSISSTKEAISIKTNRGALIFTFYAFLDIGGIFLIIIFLEQYFEGPILGITGLILMLFSFTLIFFGLIHFKSNSIFLIIFRTILYILYFPFFLIYLILIYNKSYKVFKFSFKENNNLYKLDDNYYLY